MPEQSVELIRPQDIAEALISGADVDYLDERDIQEDIVRRILASETVAEAFANATTTPAKDLDGLTITVHGVQWAKSGYQDGPVVYALLDVTREGSDEHEVVSMGGRSLMASFLWAQQQDAYPLTGVPRLVQSRTQPDRAYWTFTVEA